MQNPKSVSELLSGPGNSLNTLKTRLGRRAVVLDHVRAALPTRLAQAVASAGVEEGRLTVGVVGAVWATRLRYFTDTLRRGVSGSLGVEILNVRIRVVAPIA
jgi:hypothetical protein